MLIRVIADPPDEFEGWLERQKRPATVDESMNANQAVFLHHSCVNCHRVRGTTAREPTRRTSPT